MTFKKLNNLVKNRMKERGFGRQVDAITVIKITQELFDSKFSSFAHKINPISFKNGALTIASLSAPIASELKAHEEGIVKYINDKLKQKIVKRIRILL